MRARPIMPNTYEKLLAAVAVILLAAVLVALGRGFADWGKLPWKLWGHIGTILVALVLTPVLLLRPRGTRMHRVMGTVWVAAMFITAVNSLFLHFINPGGFSLIHVLSVLVIIMVPRVFWMAYTHRIDAHRRAVVGLVTGSLAIAGFFTLLPTRLLGSWLFAAIPALPR